MRELVCRAKRQESGTATEKADGPQWIWPKWKEQSSSFRNEGLMHQSSARGRRKCQCRRRRCPIGEIHDGWLQRAGIADREVTITRERHRTGIVRGRNHADLQHARLAGRDVKWSGGNVEAEIRNVDID